MVRFEFVIKKGQVLDIYECLDKVEHRFELRYGVFHEGATFAEIVTLDEGKSEIGAVLDKFGIKYGLERVL